MKETKVTFKDFLTKFSEVELPVTLTENEVTDFQKANDPLNPGEIARFIGEDAGGEFVEYVPCFRIPDTHAFHGLVLWRGDLMKYHYILVTYTNNGEGIGNAVIAGLESDGKSVLRSVATMDNDWVIHIVEGTHSGSEMHYEPLSSRAYRMELLPTGEIIFLLDED